MAKVNSRKPLDMTAKGNMNFADLLEGEKLHYDDHLIRVEHKKHHRDTFYGSFSVNAASQTISGTAKTWVHSKNGRLHWQVTSAKISAAAVVAAARSATLRDDKALVAKIFSGNDKITGSTFADKLYGYDGDDTIDAGGGTDRIDGGKGHDRISFVNSNKSFELVLTGATASFSYANGVQSDKVLNMEDVAGGNGNDKFTGDAQDNLLIGNKGADTLIGGKGNDTLLGGKGNDSLVGGAGDDQLDGGKHNDVLVGGKGNDNLLGGVGLGADSLVGGKGNDSLDGGGGTDTLVGGGDADTLTGGADADVFRFLSAKDSATTAPDFITDFKHKLDKLDLSAIDAVASVVGDQAFIRDPKGNANTAVAEGHIGWYQVNAAGTANDRTFIKLNIDADATIETTIELQGLVKLGAVDFIL
jgi:Ca2+-binding RTX toxin-like protein